MTVSARRLLGVGFVMVLAGAALPFLMVIGVVQSSLFLGFVAYGNSVGGLFLGLLGAASLAADRREER